MTWKNLNPPGKNGRAKSWPSFPLGFLSCQVPRTKVKRDYSDYSYSTASNVRDVLVWISGLIWKLFIVLGVLGLLIGALYEFLAPGTWYQYQLCKRGSIKGHTATFSYTTHDIQVCIAPDNSAQRKVISIKQVKKLFEPVRELSIVCGQLRSQGLYPGLGADESTENEFGRYFFSF